MDLPVDKAFANNYHRKEMRKLLCNLILADSLKPIWALVNISSAYILLFLVQQSGSHNYIKTAKVSDSKGFGQISFETFLSKSPIKAS